MPQVKSKALEQGSVSRWATEGRVHMVTWSYWNVCFDTPTPCKLSHEMMNFSVNCWPRNSWQKRTNWWGWWKSGFKSSQPQQVLDCGTYCWTKPISSYFYDNSMETSQHVLLLPSFLPHTGVSVQAKGLLNMAPRPPAAPHGRRSFAEPLCVRVCAHAQIQPSVTQSNLLFPVCHWNWDAPQNLGGSNGAERPCAKHLNSSSYDPKSPKTPTLVINARLPEFLQEWEKKSSLQQLPVRSQMGAFMVPGPCNPWSAHKGLNGSQQAPERRRMKTTERVSRDFPSQASPEFRQLPQAQADESRWSCQQPRLGNGSAG